MPRLYHSASNLDQFFLLLFTLKNYIKLTKLKNFINKGLSIWSLFDKFLIIYIQISCHFLHIYQYQYKFSDRISIKTQERTSGSGLHKFILHGQHFLITGNYVMNQVFVDVVRCLIIKIFLKWNHNKLQRF